MAQKTILIAENNPDELELLEVIFKVSNLDVSVQLTANGEEALNYLTGEKPYTDRNRYPLPALILTATRMPYRDGMSLLAWIKQQPELKAIPVIMLSSTGEKRERERAEKLGVSCYLVKPTELDELIDLVEAIGLT